jgi:hypothetical protein
MKTIHTMLKEASGHLTRNLVRSELLSERGVTTVSLEPGRNCLSIEYDPAIVDGSKLMIIMRRYGVCPEPASPQPDGQLVAD